MTETRQAIGDSAANGLVVPGAMVAVFALGVLAVGPQSPGRTRAVAFAAAVSGLGLLAAWAVGRRPRASAAGRVTASLAAMSLRLAPALVALGWLQTAGKALAADGAGGYLVVFYLAALAAEVIRTIMGERRGARHRGADDTI